MGEVSEWLGDVRSTDMNVSLAGARILISHF